MISIRNVAVAVAVVLMGVSATDASAQVRFSVAGGPSFATGQDHHLDTGYHVQLSAGFAALALPVALRVDGAFNRFSEDHGNYDVLSGTLNGILNVPIAIASPYIIGGVGAYSAEDQAHGDERETNLGLNIGGGIRLPLPGLSVFVEARYHHPFGDEAVRFVPLSFGIRF
jgi:opacity protein-like surface antigen